MMPERPAEAFRTGRAASRELPAGAVPKKLEPAEVHQGTASIGDGST